MTRPMPGPPECTCMSRGNFCWTCVDTIGYDPEEECPSCPVHAVPTKRLTTYRKCSEPKRLKDAECAAEFWRAATVSERARAAQAITRDPGDYLSVAKGFLAASREQITWHRFATRPHALEES